MATVFSPSATSRRRTSAASPRDLPRRRLGHARALQYMLPADRHHRAGPRRSPTARSRFSRRLRRRAARSPIAALELELMKSEVPSRTWCSAPSIRRSSSGRAPHPAQAAPLAPYQPELAARAIVHAALDPRREATSARAPCRRCSGPCSSRASSTGCSPPWRGRDSSAPSESISRTAPTTCTPLARDFGAQGAR